MYRGWEIMYMHMAYTEYNFFNVNINKIRQKHWFFLVLHVKFIKNSSHAYSGNIMYMYIETLIIDFVILCKAEIMSLHWEIIIEISTKWKYIQNKKSFWEAFFKDFYLLLGYPIANVDPLMRGQPHCFILLHTLIGSLVMKLGFKP